MTGPDDDAMCGGAPSRARRDVGAGWILAPSLLVYSAVSYLQGSPISTMAGNAAMFKDGDAPTDLSIPYS